MDKGEKSDGLFIASKELIFQSQEKEKCAAELVIANKEVERYAAELVIVNKKLTFEIGEKAKRATELAIANKELAFQNGRKRKRATELFSANTELIKAQEKIRHGNRMCSFISHTNQTIVRVKDEQTLFEDACSIAVNKGKFKMAWIGIADTAERRIKLVASCAASEDDLSILSDYTYSSDGPIEKALSGSDYVLISDLQKESETPWKNHANEQGFKSSICLPIKRSGEIIGVFSLYSSEKYFFDTEEIKMLIEASNDISFAATLFEENKQKKIVQQKLEYSEARLKEAQTLGQIGNWELDLITNINIWSDEIYNIFGINRQGVTPSIESFLSLLHPDDVSHARDIIPQSFQTTEAGSFNSRFIKKDTGIKHIYTEWKFEFDNNQKPVRIYGIVQDITEAKQADEALRKLESNLQTIFDNTSEGFILADRNGIVKAFNTKIAQTIFLNTEQEIKIGSSVYDFIHPSRKDNYKDVLSKVFAGEAIQYDYSFERRNGGTKWYSFSINPAYNKLDEIEGVCITSTNITERKAAEQKLYESEIFNKGVLSSLSSHLAVLDDRGILIAVNKAWDDFAKANGITSLERVAIGSNYFDVCKRAVENGDMDAAQALAGIQSVFKEETQYFEMEYPCHSPEQQRWFTLSAMSFGSDGQKVVISHQDISVKKQAEQSLQQSQSNLKAIIENTDASIYSLDTELRYIAFNKLLHDNALQVYGIDLKIGDPVLGFLKKLDIEEANNWKEKYSRALKGQTVKFEQKIAVDEYHQYISFSINPIWDNKTVVGLSCFIYDITQQKQELHQKEKMSNDLIQRNLDLEQFTYIVSHNLRAPAANIIACSEILQNETITPQEQKELLQGLSKSAAALDFVIKDINNILQIKSEANEKKEVIIFSKLVHDIMLSVGSFIDKHRVRIITDFSEVDEIFSLKIYIYSIFYNLIINSIKYGKPNKSLLLEIKSKKENGIIILTFKDNGLGIDMETHGDKIFGIYKRFHSHVEGKGMGLYMVKTQVESLGGKITVASEPNKGTMFTIVFDV